MLDVFYQGASPLGAYTENVNTLIRVIADTGNSNDTINITNGNLITTDTSSGGSITITDAIDLSDADIVNALNIGDNKILLGDVGSGGETYIYAWDLGGFGTHYAVEADGNQYYVIDADNDNTNTLFYWQTDGINNTTIASLSDDGDFTLDLSAGNFIGNFNSSGTAALCWDNSG